MSCKLGSTDTSLDVVPIVLCYNFSEITCITMLYLYPYSCLCIQFSITSTHHRYSQPSVFTALQAIQSTNDSNA